MKELAKGITECTAGSFLSRLWREIIIKDGYHRLILPLLNDYLQKLTIKAMMSNTKLMVNRTNIQQKILDESMTWKNFMFLLKDILRLKELKTTVTIKHSDNTITSYIDVGLDDDVLTRIWQQISSTLELDELMESYAIREKDNPLKVNRTNMIKKVKCSKNLSWKTFIFLVEDLMLAKELKLAIKIKNSRGTYNNHDMTYCITV